MGSGSEEAFGHEDDVAGLEDEGVVGDVGAALAADHAFDIDGEDFLFAVGVDAGDVDGGALGGVGEAAGAGDELKDGHGGLDGQGVASGGADLALDGDFAGGVFLDVDGDLGVAQEAAFLVGGLDGAFGLVDVEAGDLDGADEGEVDVALGVHAGDYGEVVLLIDGDAEAVGVGHDVGLGGGFFRGVRVLLGGRGGEGGEEQQATGKQAAEEGGDEHYQREVRLRLTVWRLKSDSALVEEFEKKS